MSKYIILAIIIGSLAVAGGIYWLGYSHNKPPVIEQTTNTTYVYADSIPAKVRVIYVQTPAGTQPAEYASMDTTLVSPSGLSSVGLSVGYNEYANAFDLRSVFTETIQKPPTPKPRLIGGVAAIGVGFADSLELHDAELSAGVEIMERYSFSIFGRTDKTYGIRCGVRF